MHVLRRLRNEDGIALVMALGVMVVLTISALAVVQMTSSNSRSASYGRANQQATSLAEAGTNFARSILWQAADPTTLAPFNGTATVEGHTVGYTGTYNSGTKTWTLTGQVTVPSPTGTSAVTRTVTTQVLVEYTEVWDPNDLLVWDRLFANSTADCSIELKNNNDVQRSIYSRGGLCLKNNDSVNASDVQVEKGLELGNNTSLSTNTLQVGGGCGKDALGKPIPCKNGGGINAKASDVAPIGLVKPTLDLGAWYAAASPGPKNPCSSGSFPGGFDNDLVMNGSRGTVSATPAASYTCTTGTGQLSWNSATDVLTVAGVVFLDGSLSFGNSLRVSGSGTVYANGNITLGNNVELCASAACDGSGFAAGNKLALVAAGNFTCDNNNKLEAAVFAGGSFETKNNTVLAGPVVANDIYLKNNSVVKSGSFGMPIAGMPGKKTTTTSLKNLDGTTKIS